MEAGDTGSDDEVRIFAPSLRALPPGAPLAMATLPVLDWNAELFATLDRMRPVAGRRCYAAVMMIDPFMLWEDLTDLLRARGVGGVVNFPPASLVEGTVATGGAEEDSKLEIDRLKWFNEAGFSLAYAATSSEQIARIDTRLRGLLDGFIHIPPDDLAKPLGHRIALESHSLSGHPMDMVWSLK